MAGTHEKDHVDQGQEIMSAGKHWLMDLLIAFGIAIFLGLMIALFSPGDFIQGVWQSALFSFILAAGFITLVRVIKPKSIIVIIALCAFLLRLVMGIWLYVELPLKGYDTPVQNAGYSYSDAYERDQVAYMKAFPDRYDEFDPSKYKGTDQYGGMTMISVAVYRLFSTDVQRPLLLVLFAAFAMSVGVLFAWKGIHLEWGERIALVAGVVLAAYPEGILLGSAQMREPILIALSTITFWATIFFKQGNRRVGIILVFGLATALSCWISIPAGLAVLMLEAGYLLLDWIASEVDSKRKWIKIGLFSVFLLAAIAAGWLWLRKTLYYDAYLTETESGMVAYILKLIGTRWRIPFVLLYGLIQPVLPAALVYQTLPIWKAIAIFRAIGWYCAIPFLLYSTGAIWKDARKNHNWGLLWISLLMLVWVVISSARAGGDQWDNPRYRAILLLWLALIIGWSWQRLRQSRAAWFWRIIILESVFVFIFTNWYLNRILAMGVNIPINWLLVSYILLTLAVIVQGIFADQKKKQVIDAGQDPLPDNFRKE